MNKFLLVLLIAFPARLSAQSAEAWASGGASLLSNPGLGSAFPGSPLSVTLDNGFRFGFRFALNTKGHIGHELQYAYNRSRLVDRTGVFFGGPESEPMAIHQFGYNFLYYLTKNNKEESRVRPFATVGGHFSDFRLQPPAPNSYCIGFNYGVGVKIKVTNLLGLRVDARQYETGKPDFGGLLTDQSGLLHQTELSAGIGIIF
jgi:opacity protein-like surface antigen